jgi:hypothetical protein
VSRGQIATLAGGLACLLAAAGLVLFARDVQAWPDTFRQGDVEFRARPGDVRPWDSPDRLPLRPAERLLDVRDDVTMRRAIRLYHLSTARDFFSRGSFLNSQRPFQPARRLLRRLDRKGNDPKVRSRAANMLAVMSYSGSSFLDPSAVRQASRLLRHAVMLDPANEEAKFNLEVLMYTSPDDSRSGESGGGTGRTQPDSGGAGITPPGRGY